MLDSATPSVLGRIRSRERGILFRPSSWRIQRGAELLPNGQAALPDSHLRGGVRRGVDVLGDQSAKHGGVLLGALPKPHQERKVA